jgi:hypothetical protein
VPNLASGGIFLNYRREDTGAYVRLLQVKLHERFPHVPVFMDLDSIEPGVDLLRPSERRLKRSKARAFAGIARAVAATDPDHAERIARSITSEDWKARALAGIAGVLAATDADGATWLSADAERVAQSIARESWRVEALVAIAEPTVT